jgi:polyisoprenoid-binding protein YceI
MSTTTSTDASLAALTAGTWNVDPSHSHIGFVARHLVVAKTRGSFGSFTGTITVGADPLQSKVEATVDAASVDTADEGRDNHLRSADFFDVENHPTWTLVSTGLVPKGGNDYTLNADLTIKGVTRPVAFDLEFEGVATDPWGNTKAGFTAETQISRKDWGLEWNVALEAGGVLVGDKVKIQLDIEALKA